MTKDERELIELKFTGLKAEIKANHDMEMVTLNSIDKQAKKTNSRVTMLEKETRIVRLFERKPILLILVLVGAFVLYGLLDLKELINIFK